MPIAFDASAFGAFVTSTSQTTAITVTGANGYLVVGVLADATSDLVTSAAHFGTPMPLLAKQFFNRWLYVFTLQNPATGTHNVVVTASGSTFLQTYIASYTGVGALENFTVKNNSGVALTTSLLAFTTGVWAVEMFATSTGIGSTTGFTERVHDTDFNGARLGDSGPVNASTTINMLVDATGINQSIMLTFAPVVVASKAVIGGTRNLLYAPSAALTTTLASLAPSGTLTAGFESSPIDNTTTGALDYFISGKITTGTSPTVGVIEIWCIAELEDNSWPDVFDGTASAETVTTRMMLQVGGKLMWFVITDATSNRTYYMPKMSTATFFGGECPRKFAFFVTHNTGVALNASAGNHALYQQAVSETFTTGTYVQVPVGTAINVGDNWQTKINAGAVGETFIIKAGTHRLQSVNPKASQRFIGETGAVMSGAAILASGSFVTAGSFWKITSQTTVMATRNGSCQVGYGGCNYCEELFFDNVRKIHVQTLGEVAAGKWFYDYVADEITVGDNPAGHVVETSITTYAFNPVVNNVTVSNLIVEKYASAAQYGAINGENTTGWVISDCTIRNNHGGAIRLGHSMQVYRNLVTLNGQIGIVGIGDNIIIDGNEISYNNDAKFDAFWEAGGTKFVLTNNLIVRNNYVHHNDGPGLWTDIDNFNSLVENNRVEDNGQIGIFHEISWSSVIRNNQVRRNGFAAWVPAGYIWGVGILVASSTDTEIYGNTVEDNNGGIAAAQQARGSGTYGVHLVTNLNVHNNSVKQSTGWTGVVEDNGDSAIFVSRNNHFEANTYLLLNSTSYFAWADAAPRNFADWQSFGHDTPVGSATIY